MSKAEEVAEKFIKHLEESLVEHLKGQINTMIVSAVQKHVDGLNKRLDSITRTMDTWKSDLDEDRKTLQDITILSNKNQSELEQIRKTVNGLPRSVGDKVEQSVNDSVASSVPQAVSDTFDVTNKKVNVEKKPRKKFLGIF